MSLRKRVLSLLLTAVMVIGMLPLSAMAAGSDLPFTDAEDIATNNQAEEC